MLLRHADEGRLWRRRQAGCVFVESVNELGLGLGLGLTLTLTLTLTLILALALTLTLSQSLI